MDQTVQITCPRCKARFREQARRIVDGFARQCPSCEAVIFFNEGSPKPEIKKALEAAQATRRALRAEAEDMAVQNAKTFAVSRHSQATLPADQDDEL